jgi:hypothetical protein
VAPEEPDDPAEEVDDPEVADCDDPEDASWDAPVDEFESPVSACTAGGVATAVPTPRKTASAPTRPTNLA